MSRISVKTSKPVGASADEVFHLLGDYRAGRPQYLPDAITDYAVKTNDGDKRTVIFYRLHATKRRIRQIEAAVKVSAGELELAECTDQASLLVSWQVAPAGPGRSEVTATVSWDGASGVGGIAERLFAPPRMRRIYGQMLDRLAVTAAV